MQVQTISFYCLAALFEITGCFAFWACLRLRRAVLWTLAGTCSLVLFALCLTRIDTFHAGRAFAAYGGTYIVGSLASLWIAEGIRPDRWDTAGALICLAGASVILWGLEPEACRQNCVFKPSVILRSQQSYMYPPESVLRETNDTQPHVP